MAEDEEREREMSKRKREKERSPIKRNDTVMVHREPALGGGTPVLNALWLSAPQSAVLPGCSQGEAVLVYALD